MKVLKDCVHSVRPRGTAEIGPPGPSMGHELRAKEEDRATYRGAVFAGEEAQRVRVLDARIEICFSVFRSGK
jgi:hypothetical protein